MSFYRTLLAAVAAVVVAAPVFADEATTAENTSTSAVQLADNSAAQSADATAQLQQSASSEQSASDLKININKASAKELMKIKGLNAAKARAIVAYRKKHGDFKSIDDLSQVKGFKKMKPEAIKSVQEQLSVQ